MKPLLFTIFIFMFSKDVYSTFTRFGITYRVAEKSEDMFEAINDNRMSASNIEMILSCEGMGTKASITFKYCTDRDQKYLIYIPGIGYDEITNSLLSG